MKQNKVIVFKFVFLYMNLSFLYYEAVAYGLRDKEPEFFDEQLRVLNEMRDVILEEFGEE